VKSPLKEADLQKAIIARAQSLGWKVMHPLPGQTPRGAGWATSTSGDGKGFPDLTLVRERIVYAELKAHGKYLTIEQKMWRDWILAAGGESKVEFSIPDNTDERWVRILQASGGDVEQASRVYSSLERGAASPQ
jgi:hypothetical protein